MGSHLAPARPKFCSLAILTGCFGLFCTGVQTMLCLLQPQDVNLDPRFIRIFSSERDPLNNGVFPGFVSKYEGSVPCGVSLAFF